MVCPKCHLSTRNQRLSGHGDEVLCARFSPDGKHIASAGFDRDILLWNTTGAVDNYGKMAGHKNGILDLQWSRDGSAIFTASADQTISSWNAETGERIRRHVGHTEIVNSIDVSRRGEEFIVSGSDDGYVGLWDPRQKKALDFLRTDEGRCVIAVCCGETGNEVYSGGIEEDICVWDLRNKKIAYTLPGHTDTITSLSLSPDASTLLSFSHDNTARTWNILPFAPENRLIRTFDGATYTGEGPINMLRASWGRDGKLIGVGGDQGIVTIWDSQSGVMKHRLPGHKGAVTDVRFSPDGSMLLSASVDRSMLLGDMPR